MEQKAQKPKVGVGVMILKNGKVLLCKRNWKSGEPKVLEPNKSESWLWYDIDNLPEPIFEMCRLSIDSYKSRKIYFDIADVK